MTDQPDSLTAVQEQTDTDTLQAQEPRILPPYHVVLLDDNDHTYDYVVEMLTKLFGHPVEAAFLMACEVDNAKRVVVDTTTKERAEFKRDQIHAYGADWRLERSAGSMSAIIEPVPE